MRIISTVVAFYLCFSQIELAALFYTIGQGLDAVDGVTARYFNQCSKFGAVLDMLTDRMSTAVLLVVLALLYPDMWGAFAFLIVLDIVSHWFQMYWLDLPFASILFSFARFFAFKQQARTEQDLPQRQRKPLAELLLHLPVRAPCVLRWQ